jgi:hypothetical protein
VVRQTPDPNASGGGWDANEEEEIGANEDGALEIRRGDVWVLRWSAVRKAVARGDVELV